MEFRKLTTWIGLAGLTVALAGCPGGDDSSSDTIDSGPDLTTTTNASTSTTTADTDNGTTAAEGSTGMAESSDGPMMTTMSMDSSSGEPPAMCGLVVQLDFPNPACGPCAEANCCDALQTCFGDENTMKMTECLLLNNCIAMNCAMVQPADLQMCIDDNCAENAGAVMDWLGYQQCLGMNCLAECS